MKKIFRNLKFIIPALILLVVIIIFLYEPALSEVQKDIIDLYGEPSQFVITYLPRGDADNPQLVRSETWYYPEFKKSISFLGGNLSSEDIYNSEQDVEDTALKPQDFDFFLTYKDMQDIFGVENIVPVDSLPVFYEKETLATYLTDSALFIIENNQLTYFQTVGLGDTVAKPEEENQAALEEEPQRKEEQEQVQQEQIWKSYKNQDLKMSIKYPEEWYLDDDNTVLSTYDTGYLEKGLELPEKRLKCDFFMYENSDIDIDDEKQIIDDHVSVYEGKAEEESEEGPGLGDSKLFIFKQDKEDTVGLLCFTYDKSFYSKLVEMLKTFKYTD